VSRRVRAGLAALAAASMVGGAGCGAGGDGVSALDGLDGPHVGVQVRPDTPNNGLLFHFDPGDVVETFGSTDGNFLVHFTRQGPNAVPALDADASGTPDFVEQVASVYVDVLKKYHDDLGFRAPRGDTGLPDNGGDGRFDVYLVDFAGKGDGNYQNDVCDPANSEICAGYMIQENDFKGYGYPSNLVATRILGSHEFFHAVQAAYDDGQGSVMAEGTAVWATETFDPSLNDFEGFLNGYLDNPDRPLDTPLPGPVDPFSYGSAIFFQFLEEHYGAGTIRALWERCENGANSEANPVWFQEIEPLLQKQSSTTFADAFTDFATWNLFMGSLADPARAYKSGAGYPSVSMHDEAAPFSKDALRVYYASSQYYRLAPGARKAMTAALVAPPDAPDETKDLRVLLAVKRGSAYDPVELLSDATAGTETIDTAGADKLVAVVINTSQSGSSRKPALCIGDAAEVAACRAAAGNTGTGGSGGAGGAAGTGGGGGQAPPPKAASGCGCRVTEPAPEGGAAALVVGVAAALSRRRRRGRVRAG
jgi:MYXO-CTERM domain-containing protein